MSPPVREDGGQPVKSFRGTKKLAENLLFWQTSGILKKIAIGMTSWRDQEFWEGPPHCGGREIDESDLD